MGQFDNPLYSSEKMFRLTASNFGEVIKRRDTTPCDALVKKILRDPHVGVCCAAINYGKRNEIVAIKLFEAKYDVKVQPSGLYISLLHGWLAASPDGTNFLIYCLIYLYALFVGIINDHDIVEVKCLYKVAMQQLSLLSAVQDGKVPCLVYKEDRITLKRTHNYFFQVTKL